MTYFSFDRTFKTILLPVNTMQVLLDIEDYEAIFSNGHNHLSDEGRFIFQIFKPEMNIMTRDLDEKFDVIEYDDPYGRGETQVKDSTRYDSSTQILHITWYYYLRDELYREIDWKLGILFPKEIDALLKYNGFEVENKYGDHDRGEFTHESNIQVIVAKKRE